MVKESGCRQLSPLMNLTTAILTCDVLTSSACAIHRWVWGRQKLTKLLCRVTFKSRKVKHLVQHNGAGTNRKHYQGSQFSHRMATQQTRAAVVLAPGAKCKAQAGEQEKGNPGPKSEEPGQEGVLKTPGERGQSEFGDLHPEQYTNRQRRVL